jgi:simple sugar transport system permease protein
MTSERLVGLMLVALCLITGLANQAFFSLATVFDTLRNLTVVGIFGMAVLVVMLTGGIDVSFPAIAALTSYSTIRIFIALGLDGPLIAILALAVVFGVLLGLADALMVALLRLPALIVTLGTSSLVYGFNLFFLGSQNLFNVPKTLVAFSHSSLLQVADAQGRGR